MSCKIKQTFFDKLFKRQRYCHVWKDIKEENLKSWVDWGSSPAEMTTFYEIAVHCKCIKCGKESIYTKNKLFPVKE